MGGEGEMYGKGNMETYITVSKIDSQRGGMGRKMGDSLKGRQYMYTYG